MGFWGAVGRLRLSDVVSVENVSSLVLGGAGALVLVLNTSSATRHGVAGDYLAIAAALVGVVFAGLALVVALLSESYMKLLAESTSGVTGFLSPFMIAIGLQVGSLLISVAYRALGELPAFVPVEPWFFGAATVLFVTSCLEVIVLARNVFMHARLRVKQQTVTLLEQQRLQRQQGQRR